MFRFFLLIFIFCTSVLSAFANTGDEDTPEL